MPWTTRVHRHALGRLAEHAVPRAEIGQVAPPAEQRASRSRRARACATVSARKRRTPAVAREVGVDGGLRLAARDAELAREPERREAVDDAEVHRLGARALRRRSPRPARCPPPPPRCGGGRPRRCGRPRAGSRPRRSARGCAARPASSRPRAAGVPSAGTNASRMRTPLLAADRDVLHVRVRGREPPGGGAGLVEGRMDAPGARVHERRQRVDVGAAQLGEAAVREDVGRQLVVRGELLEHALVGREAGLRLLRRPAARASRRGSPGAASASRSGSARPRARRRAPRAARAPSRTRGEPLEHRLVDAHALALHRREHRGERELDVLEERAQAVALEARRERAPRGRAARRPRRRPSAAAFSAGSSRGGDRLRPAAGELLEGLDALAELLRREGGGAVLAGGVEQEGGELDVEGGERGGATPSSASRVCTRLLSRDTQRRAPARPSAGASASASSAAPSAGAERHVGARPGAVAKATPAGSGGRPLVPCRPTQAEREARQRRQLARQGGEGRARSLDRG